MWERFVREARRSPRLVGVLLFGLGLTIYGLAAGDSGAAITGAVILALVVAIMTVPGS